MGRKAHIDKPKKKHNVKSSADLEVENERKNQLYDLIQVATRENEAEEKRCERIISPLTRCTSLPIVHAEPMRQSLFWDDSKSVDYGFEPNPKVPGADVVLDANPQKLIKSLKKGLQISKSKLSFKCDVSDDKLLGAVKRTSKGDFLKTRVGSKNLDAILGHLDVNIDEELFADRRRNRRIMWCLIGVGLGAICLAISLSLFGEPRKEDMPRVVPTIAEDTTPFEYLPPGKVLASTGSNTVFRLECRYPDGQIYRPSNLGVHLLYGFIDCGLRLGNAYPVEEVYTDNTASTKHEILWNYQQMLPTAVWYGFEFVNESIAIETQFHILLEDIVFPKMLERFKADCTTPLSSVTGYIDTLRQTGSLFQLSIAPYRPPGVSDKFEGHIRRAYKKLQGK